MILWYDKVLRRNKDRLVSCFLLLKYLMQYDNVQAESALALVMPIAFDLDLFYIAPFYHRYFAL